MVFRLFSVRDIVNRLLHDSSNVGTTPVTGPVILMVARLTEPITIMVHHTVITVYLAVTRVTMVSMILRALRTVRMVTVNRHQLIAPVTITAIAP